MDGINSGEKGKGNHHEKICKGRGKASFHSSTFILLQYSTSNFRKQCKDEQRMLAFFFLCTEVLHNY